MQNNELQAPATVDTPKTPQPRDESAGSDRNSNALAHRSFRLYELWGWSGHTPKPNPGTKH